MPTTFDPNQFDVDKFLKDRQEQKPWRPVEVYKKDRKGSDTKWRNLADESKLRDLMAGGMSPNEIRGIIGHFETTKPPREFEPDPMECPNCEMTGRFLKDDYMCVVCRDKLEEERNAA